ncbi:unnamed protein product [Didymodactylos carnosus]|uniref:SecA DEAD-like N-terminal domain-containing protein n=1 Tax=Didymodactylos carnosus TaxID=1234261 RepID=A0A815M9V4_9BILA|nr:unnamed protein product [Didymodactylos carnosus]CAF1415177.1 unnamed protein product [Didymodactylos carnosus]CAF4139109.1 unnamed protein product [Didymodactylos carnosus]CAF4301536.1 unnamed protein product [Didymodactylos carnosus]
MQNEIDRPRKGDVKLTHELLSCAALPITTQTSLALVPKEEPLDFYQSILIENLHELNELEWQQSDIVSLKNKFTSPEIYYKISSLKTALLIIKTIITSGISSQIHIDRIVKTIKKNPVEQWMNVLNKIVDEQGKAKSVDILLAELVNENPSLNIKKLRKQYETVMNYYKGEISNWTSTDIETNHKCNDEHKKVAIIIQATHLYKQYRPRDIQILSLLLLIDKSENGRLAQIRTGEGKSIIVSILTVYLSRPLLNKHVDIITTSEILAQRDADEFAPFYLDAVEFIRKKLAEKELVHYPTYRQEYINAKLPKRIRGARRALYELTLNVDYVISKDR